MTTHSLLQIRSPALDKKRGHDDVNEWDARSKKWAHLRPSQATIYLENRCHLKCDHCYEDEASHPPQLHADALTIDDYARIFDELAALGTLDLTLTGGEIFLRRDALDIVELARKKRFAVTLFTSGTLIDEKKADRIAELKVQKVEISLYSHDAAVHDAFTGTPGSHAKSVRALQLLKARGVKTLMKGNLTTFNVDHIDEMMALASSLGTDFTFDPTVKPRMNGDDTPQKKYQLSTDELRRKVFSRPELYAAFRKFEPDALCTGNGSLLGDDDAMCGAAWAGLSIGADGGVSACGFFASTAGSLKERSLKEIWFGAPQFDDIRETTFGSMNSCPTCDVKSTCTPCMAYAEIEQGTTKGCSSHTLQLATAIHELAVKKVAANDKMERGKALPLVGDRTMIPPASKGGKTPLSTE